MSKIVFWEETVKCTKNFEEILFFLHIGMFFHLLAPTGALYVTLALFPTSKHLVRFPNSLAWQMGNLTTKPNASWTQDCLKLVSLHLLSNWGRLTWKCSCTWIFRCKISLPKQLRPIVGQHTAFKNNSRNSSKLNSTQLTQHVGVYPCPISLVHLLKTHVLVHGVNLHKDDADSWHLYNLGRSRLSGARVVLTMQWMMMMINCFSHNHASCITLTFLIVFLSF